jgi:hypothetical protein
MNLVDLVFRRRASNSIVSFADMAQKTSLPIMEVRAFHRCSLKQKNQINSSLNMDMPYCSYFCR